MQKPDFHLPPVFRKLKRGGPAIVLPKDSGTIIAYAGIGRDSVVVEGGAGTGFLTVALATIAKNVISYEKKPEFAGLVRENLRRAGMENVELREKDILDGIDERNLDAVVLDIPEAEKAVALAADALASHGTLVAYLPNIEQAKAFALQCQTRFRDVFMLETLVREYEIRPQGVRPQHWGLMHTAYLVFARK